MDLNRNQVFTAKRVSRRKSEGSANKGGGGTGKECAQYKLLQSRAEAILVNWTSDYPKFTLGRISDALNLNLKGHKVALILIKRKVGRKQNWKMLEWIQTWCKAVSLH